MAEDGQGMEPGGREAVVDQEHLRILWLGYWISAGATAFFGLLGLLYMAMGLVAGGTIPHNTALPRPPIDVGRFLGLLGAGFFALSDVVIDYTDAALGELLARYRSLEGVGRSASE